MARGWWQGAVHHDYELRVGDTLVLPPTPPQPPRQKFQSCLGLKFPFTYFDLKMPRGEIAKGGTDLEETFSLLSNLDLAQIDYSFEPKF